MNPKILEWLKGRDTGLSSRAIVAKMENIDIRIFGERGYDHPQDPADLGRCIRLLLIAREYRQRLHEMADCSPQWKALVEHWDELEKLYYLGLSRANRRAPECYKRMRELISQSTVDALDL